MSFFGKNTARNSAQFAQDAGEWRKDSEARNLQTEIDQVGREVMQALASVKPEEMAKVMPQIAQMLKSKNYSERALVAGINLAMGYTKANLSNQQAQAQTKTAENQNAAYADEQAVKGALADMKQHPQGTPWAPQEDYEKTRLGALTPTQQFSALGAQTATKAAAADAALQEKKTLAEIAKLNAEAGAKSSGSTKDQEGKYANEVQAIQNKYGWQKDMNEAVTGTVLRTDWPAIQADLKARGINSVTLDGEKIDTNGGWPGGKKAAVTIKINPYGTGSEDLSAPTKTSPQGAPISPIPTAKVQEIVNNKNMDLPMLGPQNDPNLTAAPQQGALQQVASQQGAPQQGAPQQGQSLQQSMPPIQSWLDNATPKAPTTLTNLAPNPNLTPKTSSVPNLAPNPNLVPKPSNENLTDTAPSLGAAVKHKTRNTTVKRKTDLVSIPEGTLANTNNNPGNLRFAGQKNAVQGKGGFAKFKTPKAGYEALKRQISLDAGRGHTVQTFISKYAPPSENNTKEYLNFVVTKIGVPPTALLSDVNLDQLAQVMAQKESGTSVNTRS